MFVFLLFLVLTIVDGYGWLGMGGCFWVIVLFFDIA